METNVFEIVLRHLQYIVGVSQEYIAAILILCHILYFTLFEVF